MYKAASFSSTLICTAAGPIKGDFIPQSAAMTGILSRVKRFSNFRPAAHSEKLIIQ